MNKLKLIAILSFFFLSFEPTVKTKNYVYNIVHEENNRSSHFSILNEIQAFKANKNLEYFWFNNNNLKSNYGGFTGNLLHGKFQEFDSGGNLIKNGNFSFGLKNGDWQFWDKKGNLTGSEYWVKGWLKRKWFIEDSIKYIEKYKMNKIDGERKVLKDNKVVKIQNYRGGILIAEKIVKANNKIAKPNKRMTKPDEKISKPNDEIVKPNDKITKPKK